MAASGSGSGCGVPVCKNSSAGASSTLGKRCASRWCFSLGAARHVRQHTLALAREHSTDGAAGNVLLDKGGQQVGVHLGQHHFAVARVVECRTHKRREQHRDEPAAAVSRCAT
jgi:hypothetical protein